MNKDANSTDSAERCQHVRDDLDESIWSYNLRQESLAIEMVTRLVNMFEKCEPSASSELYRFTSISSEASFDELLAGRGFYLILSDYVPQWKRQNVCSLKVDGLSVLYRGQADKVRERLRSHLDNRRYRQWKNEKEQSPLERCLKLDEVKGNKGGINVDEMPFSQARWAVIVLPMSKSASQMREMVEWAFDHVFGRPVASNERKQIPHAVKVALHRQKESYEALKLLSEKIFTKVSEQYDNSFSVRL